MPRRKAKIFILCPYPQNTIGSQRFRFEQYIKELSSFAFINQFSFWSPSAMKILYVKGKKAQKIFHTLWGLTKRFLLLPFIIRADFVFIHRESIPLGHGLYEWAISKVLRRKIIFDFDDAIWLSQTSKENEKISWLKSKNKTSKICSFAHKISCGNAFLANYSLNYNKNVIIIPTTIDTEYHKSTALKTKETITIGWTGSQSTVPHFELILPVLSRIKAEFGTQVQFKMIGDSRFHNPNLELKGNAWNLETEIEDLCNVDIGIMPLPDDIWSKGKCGFKGLQYMSLEIPTVMSPVGVNNEIIEHNQNGFIANNQEEWFTILSHLIKDKELRRKIGHQGRKTIINRYSKTANLQKYYSLFNITHDDMAPPLK